ncbi:hypothetical protein PVK06_006198 [Gossypium arboreum]|uniref:Uncharacterized protein n=1 Tax=Gossypium arboreum TaxID=29729 RepID=A0ABR0QWV4_GOSAR|nr:hypothetical protein PVK06_006198 [Gossypium arboreum]
MKILSSSLITLPGYPTQNNEYRLPFLTDWLDAHIRDTKFVLQKPVIGSTLTFETRNSSSKSRSLARRSHSRRGIRPPKSDPCCQVWKIKKRHLQERTIV